MGFISSKKFGTGSIPDPHPVKEVPITSVLDMLLIGSNPNGVVPMGAVQDDISFARSGGGDVGSPDWLMERQEER